MHDVDIGKKLASLSEEERLEVEKLLAEEQHAIWIPNAGPQTRAAFSPADILLYGGSGGGGKEQPLVAKVLSPSGWLRIGDLEVGSKISATDGTTQEVIGVYPQGVKDIYRVTMRDGGCAEVGLDHLWLARVTDFNSKIIYSKRLYTTSDIIKLMKSSDKSISFSIPGLKCYGRKDNERVIDRIEHARKDDAVCIRVSNKDSLYITDDYIITHNTDLDLGLAFTQHQRSLMLRRKYTDLSSIIDRAIEINGSRSGFSGSPPPKLRTADGRLIQFGANQFLGDEQNWQGAPYDLKCVAGWTPVLMSDGSYRPMKSVQVGDSVQTLEGAREVKRVWPVRRDRAVRLTVLGDCGELVCYQDQSLTHEVLTRDGWVSRDMCGGAFIPTCFEADALGKTPRHSGHINTYSHPYTMETRQALGGMQVRASPLYVHEIGEIDLYDIEVDEVNHYITKGGIVNRNCFDEAVQFLEFQIRFHLGWVRSSDPNQRCRAVLSSNPPISAEGDWIIKFFRPWLDLTHPKPAKPGELRWFITDEKGEDVEVDGPEPIERGGRTYRPQSRSFIPARLNDNPYLVRTNYQSTLDSLPEPLRSAVRDGNFMAARPDADFQVIPTEWILLAQERWRPDGWKDHAMTAMALDPAGGGKDAEELVFRYGGWFSGLFTDRGKRTEGSSKALVEIFMRRRDGAPVIVDVGGGYAGVAISRLRDNHVDFQKFDGSAAGHGRAIGMKLPFYNKRAEAWWRFREALDPNQDGGSIIALPPDPELRADLSAPCYLETDMQNQGVIKLESKKSLRERLGRSPGKGDAVVMCLAGGASIVQKMIVNPGVVAGLPAYAITRSSGPLARYRRRSPSRNKLDRR